MHLKSIELQGFKSFANKINFEFDEGITGIVGPNGSGKSNIADAVRWVLGAQSAKQLRGSKMEDVIFAGTENRRPVGYSQVNITIDNHDKKMAIDYLEVTISRRIYRSGESEFYINKTPCRLKDIHELFFDTGVGKEGYSIIGQGQIDKILSTKPEDRRDLFDEAAGIVKFKRRKSIAYKKLEEEKQNLIRINDIIRELDGQKDSLCGQAEIAKKYLTLKEELKKYEVNIFIKEFEKLNDSINKINEEENQIKEEIHSVNKSHEEIKVKYNNTINLSENLTIELDNKKDEISSLNIDKEKKENNIKIANEQIRSINIANERIQQNINELNSRNELNNSNINQYNELLATLKLDKNKLHENLKAKEDKFTNIIKEISQKEITIEEIKSSIIDRLNEITSVKSKMQRYSAMLENINNRKKTLSDKLSHVHNDKKLYYNKKVTSLEEVEVHENELKLTKNNKEEVYNHIKKITQDKMIIEERLNTINKQMNNYTSRYNALNDITEHYEGYNYSIRKVMELKSNKKIHGVLGVVADVINVNKKYEIAIETALGASVQNIITKDEDTAKWIINYLKTNKYGRATFLPLTSIRTKNNYNKVNNAEGFIGYASDLVEYDNIYENVIKYLLGRVIIVDNIDNGVKLAKKYNYTLKIVTLTGDVLNPGGSLTGGSYKNKSNNFLSRKRELEELQSNINEITKTLQITEQEKIKIIHKEQKLTDEVEKLTSKEHELNIKINSLQISIKQISKEIHNSELIIKEGHEEINELDSQNKELNTTLEKYNQQLYGTETENTDAESKVVYLTDEATKNKEIKESLNEEITNLKITLTSIKQKISSTGENIVRLKKELHEIDIQREKNLEEVKNNELSISEKTNLINEYEEDTKRITNNITIKQQELVQLNEQKEQISLQQKQLFEERENLSNKSNLLEKEVLRLQNSKIKYELNKENTINYMWEEYELTFNMALQYRDDIGSMSILKQNVKKLKIDIRELGDVNVNAIEEYKEVITRFNFLTEQKDDLIQAEKKLIEVINELDKEMCKQFRIKFQEINIRFNQVFNELFGGGKGILQLVDEDNILESGINIIAQPPGKKLQSMMLLSGGERAFTAIALLFAIQKLKPSPFCVLDEIEAALDDANVERFANYLQKLSHNTQFIIITHRRGTMEVADALYGITMQEKGVSTRVSVKLIESELTG
ncbi:MAG: chromosome segregation protein SMC [Vallitalea sp.]|jgi:chromosome segregation protein|nr:chromosome segregation protein SMC [Vallitalea sp.]